jgi:hypothetical protein
MSQGRRNDGMQYTTLRAADGAERWAIWRASKSSHLSGTPKYHRFRHAFFGTRNPFQKTSKASF